MSTRSTIAIIHRDNSVQSVYAHWDGYLSHNGAILYQHYRDPEKIKKLIDLGNISNLSADIDAPAGHSYHKRVDNKTVFYGRDRGETDQMASQFDSLKEYMADGDFQEYDYVFKEKNSKWYLIDHNNSKLLPLSTLLNKNPDVSLEVKTLIKAEILAKRLEKELIEKNSTHKMKL